MQRTAVIRIHYDHPPERVWRVLATREGMAAWLMDNDFEPVANLEFSFRAPAKGTWDGVISCRVLVVDPPRRLSYTWSGLWGDSTVHWTLTPAGNGTDVLLEHSGFKGVQGILLSFMLASGWKRKLRLSVPALLDVAKTADHPAQGQTI